MTSRYSVSASAGVRDGNRYAVLDSQNRQSGATRRVSFHRTFKQAQAAARKLNADG